MVDGKEHSLLLHVLVVITAAAVGVGATYQPRIDPSDFKSQISNPYFLLVPGTRYQYLETVFGEMFNREITVTSETKAIMGIKCVSVHDVLTAKGEVREDTYDWYAQDKKGAVWYFGEATVEIKPGRRRTSAGSWEAGVGGALPGIVMPAEAKAGAPYRQEYYLNWAEDMGQIIAVGETVIVPAGTFTNCLRTKEWSLLESGSEKRWYAPQIGLVRSEAPGEVVVLMSIKRP